VASLLEDLRTVGVHLETSELPTGSEIANVVGGLLKTLEHAGVTVAEELLPKPVDDVVEPIVAAVEPALAAEQDKVIAALQAKIDKLEAAATAPTVTSSGFSAPGPLSAPVTPPNPTS
jgi:hypothetical protein